LKYFLQAFICGLQLSRYKEAVVVYIAGYVIRMVRKNWTCQTCLDALISSRSDAEQNPAFALLNRKRWGNLIDASPDVVSLCIETEKVFTALTQGNAQSISGARSISSKIVVTILN
jgi:hypothetical protein